MRRVGLVVIGVSVAVLGLVTPAVAEPSPTAAGAGSAAETVCTLADNRLTGLTGLLALDGGGYVVANSLPDQTSGMRVYYLDSKCKITRFVSYGANPARDPEDLALASDGTVWVADTGDNTSNKAGRRATVALWKVPAGDGNPVIHRLTYPDGPHDARAMLFGANDTPIVITKEPGGGVQIYEPTEQLQPGTQQGVPLKKVGSWQPKRTGTSNFLGATGQVLVTGAAQSPDRKRVVLRTYSDAYEWNVPDGDIVKAITTGQPRVTPLIGEGQGEAQGEGIAYSADGKSFLTCSAQAGSRILRYQPVAAQAPAAPAADQPADKKADTRSWYQKLSLPQIINVVAAMGVLGLVLVVVGVVGIRRSRRARRKVAGETRAETPGKGTGGPRPPAPNVPPVFPDARQQGRAVVAPPAPPAPPADPRTDGRAHPGYGAGGGGGGNVYGGGHSQSGHDRRTGPQQYSQPGYHPGYDSGGRYYPERL
ncbi:MAG TPA: hypothetical protein VGP31_02100 [Planosporangium sp.]|jgi:sugar lactone lactonase YvrE|nr:hypothetical protein [Planosporangium sp.]